MRVLHRIVISHDIRKVERSVCGRYGVCVCVYDMGFKATMCYCAFNNCGLGGVQLLPSGGIQSY